MLTNKIRLLSFSQVFQKTPVILLILFLFIYLLTSRGHVQNSDEVAMFATLTNLMEHHTLAIDELAGLNQVLPLKLGFYGPDRHLYSKYAPGNVLLAIGLYWIGAIFHPALGGLLALYLNAFIGAITMLLLYHFTSRYFRRATAVVVVLLIGFCSDWWYQARGFGLETGGGFFLLASLLLADMAKPVGSAACFGTSLLFRTLNSLALPIWALSIRRSGRRALWSVIPFVFTGLGLVVYNWLRYHSIFNFGYDNVGFNTPVLYGLSGLLFSPGRSVFIYSPIFLLIVPGIWGWFKRDKLLTATLLLTVVIYILAIAMWVSWDSGWSWGSRLLMPIVPLIGILLTPVIERSWSSRWLMIPIALLAILGVGIEILTLVRDPLMTLKEAVMVRGLPYEETLWTMRNSWLALQLHTLAHFTASDIDAFILRLLLSH